MKTTTAILAVLAVLGLATVPFATASHPVSGDYLMGATPGLSVTACTPDLGCTGGHIFAADLFIGHKPRAVSIADASGGAVDFTAAQDFDGNGISGEAGEPRVDGCGTSADFSASEVPFVAANNVAVFIRIWSPNCPANVATSGSVTVTTF